ncbi:MAG: YigZ family protein [Clostridiales bacterium]|jgi:uncharacterized YigZ family protein|nr:YigZ family protein [Clostridiales bacterium]
MLEEFLTFERECEAEYVDRKSRFISCGRAVYNEEDTKTFLESRRNFYKDARHHVYAYCLTDESGKKTERFNDDREPSGTAGMPVLNLIRRQGLQNAMIVVTRYFGGVLLGSGGLTHAYGHSAQLLFKADPASRENSLNPLGNVVKKVRSVKISLTTDYVFLGKLQYLIGQSDVILSETNYTDTVRMDLILRESYAQSFKKSVMELTAAKCEIITVGAMYHSYPFN